MAVRVKRTSCTGKEAKSAVILSNLKSPAMLYLLIAFGIFLMAVGIAFIAEARHSHKVH